MKIGTVKEYSIRFEYFEHGTKDHWIEPVNKKALHWIKSGWW